MGAQIVNLEGTQYISDVPSVYYGATSSLVSKIDPFAGNLMGKVTLPGGTVISTTINLIKDPNNPGKVIASIYTPGVESPLLSLSERGLRKKWIGTFF